MWVGQLVPAVVWDGEHQEDSMGHHQGGQHRLPGKLVPEVEMATGQSDSIVLATGQSDVVALVTGRSDGVVLVTAHVACSKKPTFSKIN